MRAHGHLAGPRDSCGMDADVLIVGGGLNGPVLALALAQAGLSALVIDALPEGAQTADGFDGRAYALALASRRMLAALGIWKQVAEQAQPILDIVVSDGRAGEGAGPLSLHFDHDEIEEGPMGFMLEDRFLRIALAEVPVLRGQRVVAQTGRSGFRLGDAGRRAGAARAGSGRRRRAHVGGGGASGDRAQRARLWPDLDRVCGRA